MNVLLLGNGFDLYHCLPTKYHNFLHTVDFLISHQSQKFYTVADVFGTESLRVIDGDIGRCYEKHSAAYSKCELDQDKVKRLIQLACNNYWFKYLNKSFNKDVGWIDFEKEVAVVLEAFRLFKKQDGPRYGQRTVFKDNTHSFIIDEFGFFLEKNFTDSWDLSVSHKVCDEYNVEYPLSSGIRHINHEKIIKKLIDQLNELSEALKLYLDCFVDLTVSYIFENETIVKYEPLNYADFILTFNYTNTFEKGYSNNPIFHIHGNVNEKIVLGVNPDFYDDGDAVDTSFVAFKKYFQRVLYSTDTDYLSWISEIKNSEENVNLVVMGHSLDVTDEDIIKELFLSVHEIFILYHDDSAMFSYISNLIKMFGKSQFDMLRKDKNLRFMDIKKDAGKVKDILESDCFFQGLNK